MSRKLDWVDHIVRAGASSKELRELTQGKRTMMVRGDSASSAAYRRAGPGDTLYLASTSHEAVRAGATFIDVLHCRGALAGRKADPERPVA
jgi:hypothetical protein